MYNTSTYFIAGFIISSISTTIGYLIGRRSRPVFDNRHLGDFRVGVLPPNKEEELRQAERRALLAAARIWEER